MQKVTEFKQYWRRGYDEKKEEYNGKVGGIWENMQGAEAVSRKFRLMRFK